MNIAGNAIKFTQRGSITIGVEAGPAPGKDKSVLRISVRDTGIGIPQEKIEAIFEAFTQVDSSITRTYGGTGLGLTIAKSLVEMMGGTIAVESELSKGSTFVVTLELAPGNPSVYQDIALAHLEILRGKRQLSWMTISSRWKFCETIANRRAWLCRCAPNPRLRP